MSLIIPVILMITLTICVWIALYATRIPYMLKNHIDAQKWAQTEGVTANTPLYLQNISNNFKNLFEVPVLFYALTILMISSMGASNFDIWMAYIFVGARAAHSLIHCTYNRVMHRFSAYVISNFALIAMLISAIFKVF